MFIVSIIALMAYSLVIARCVVFLSLGGRFRQDDHAEIAFLMVSTVLLMLGHIQLWYAEPWKVINNSDASALVVGHSVFIAGYIFHRVGSLIVGRDRRVSERRQQARQ
nr:hypothetical protein [uncultured Pseudomonas sp.]